MTNSLIFAGLVLALGGNPQPLDSTTPSARHSTRRLARKATRPAKQWRLPPRYRATKVISGKSYQIERITRKHFWVSIMYPRFDGKLGLYIWSFRVLRDASSEPWLQTVRKRRFPKSHVVLHRAGPGLWKLAKVGAPPPPPRRAPRIRQLPVKYRAAKRVRGKAYKVSFVMKNRFVLILTYPNFGKLGTLFGWAFEVRRDKRSERIIRAAAKGKRLGYVTLRRVGPNLWAVAGKRLRRR